MADSKYSIGYFSPHRAELHHAKVEVQPDGFTLDGQHIEIKDIISVYFRSIYNVETVISLPVYEILTRSDRLLLTGEHQDLHQLFNSKLASETNSYHKLIGTVIRWKQPGAKYYEVSVKDSVSRNLTEPLALTLISTQLVWAFILITLAVCIISVIVFIYLLQNP